MATFVGYVMAQITVPAASTISVTTNAGGPTVVTLTAGTYESVIAFAVQLQADLISQRSVSGGTWTVTVSTTTGKATIAVTNSTYSITWTDTNPRDLLGFTANIVAQSTSTGTQNCRGFWLPDRPVFTESRYKSAPRETDLRQTESPTGNVISHVGNSKYVHPSLTWHVVANNKAWIADETTVSESFEQFLVDAQWGLGHSWFKPGSKCMIIGHDGNEVGNTTVAGWYFRGCAKASDAIKRSDAGGWDGQWNITIPGLVTDS